MSATFTRNPGAGSVVPLMVTEYNVQVEPGTFVHRLAGTANVAVVLAAAGPREGTLDVLVGSATDAATAVAFFSSAALFTLVDTDAPAIGMDFAVSGGRVTSTPSPTRRTWIVTVPFVEVS